MAIDWDELKRAVAAAGAFTIGGLTFTNTAELSNTLAEVLPTLAFAPIGIMLIVLTWGLVSWAIYVFRGFAPPLEVQLTPDQVDELREELIEYDEVQESTDE